MDDYFAVIAKCVMCDFALYIKCAAPDINMTDASEQWACFCNLNCLFRNEGIYAYSMSHKMLYICLDFQTSVCKGK